MSNTACVYVSQYSLTEACIFGLRVPIVEHNSVIWSPYTARDIDAVESVQRRFTKRLPTLRNMSYNDRLRYLNIPSLELRRLHTDLFWCYKVVFRLRY